MAAPQAWHGGSHLEPCARATSPDDGQLPIEARLLSRILLRTYRSSPKGRKSHHRRFAGPEGQPQVSASTGLRAGQLAGALWDSLIAKVLFARLPEREGHPVPSQPGARTADGGRWHHHNRGIPVS